MFRNCVSLQAIPELPATTLQKGCYYLMFCGCISITQLPVFIDVVLAEDCYAGMFRDCTGIIIPPDLPSINLVKNCYQAMFYGCYNIKLSETEGNGDPDKAAGNKNSCKEGKRRRRQIPGTAGSDQTGSG